MAGRLQARAPDTLPRPLTSFIGRRHDISALGRALAATRLLTLVGVGGCGKTRLAREVAATSLDAYSDGVWWVDLAPLADPTLIIQTLATACHAAERPDEALQDTLVARLASIHSLLILDNCEHLIDACAQVAQTLLSSCASLSILATSRETLNIAGETVYAVPTLDLPDVAPGQVASAADLDAIRQSDAVQLFVERAAAVSPAFTLDQATAPVVVDICRRLDGLPLAIELAAARVRVLSLDDIATRLTSAIPLLTSGSRTAAPRHQTLRAMFDWSYALLSDAEALLFQRLAVFAGSFTLEAAEAVGGAASGQALGDTQDILDLLGRLIDKSLVTVVREPGGTSGQGPRRYRLLEMLRQYGMEKLTASGQLDDARGRHFAYYLQLARQAEAELEGPTQLQWLNRLEQEHDNIRAALRWRIESARDDGAARLASRIWRFWLTRGYLSEGRRWLGEALTLAPQRDRTRAYALFALSVLTFLHEGYNAAMGLAEEALALFHELDDPKGLALVYLDAGILALGRGDHAQAIAYLEESLPRCSQVGYTHGFILALSSMGRAALCLGDYARAQALVIESVAAARASEDSRTLAGALTDLGVTYFEQSAYTQARPHFEESLAIRRLHGDKGGAAHTLYYLGRLALAEERPDSARTRFDESFALRLAIGDLEGQAAALEGFGALAAQASDGASAARCFGAAEAARERVRAPVPTLDRPFVARWTAATRDLLGEAAFACALAAGRALTPAAAAPPPTSADTAASAEDGPVHASDASLRRPEAQREPRAPVALRIYALGAPRVYLQGRLIEPADWTYAKARELLFFLLTHGPASKERIGLTLWPDADAAHVRQQFHPALHALRRALGDPDWVRFERGRYRFNRDRAHSYDVAAFEAALTQARQALADAPDAPGPAITLLENAARLYRGDFLVGESGHATGEWIATYRAELRQRWLDALTLLAGLRISTSDHARAVAVYRRLIEADPYQEQAHRALMLLLARIGERAQALRHFESLTRLLRDELATSPAPETATLAEALRTGAPL